MGMRFAIKSFPKYIFVFTLCIARSHFFTMAKGLTVTETITVFYLQSLWVKGVRKQVVKDITTPPYPWQPMLVLANRKSGDNLGQSVLQMFRHLLNPAQVILNT